MCKQSVHLHFCTKVKDLRMHDTVPLHMFEIESINDNMPRLICFKNYLNSSMLNFHVNSCIND